MSMPDPFPNLVFHHLGVATSSVANEVELWEALGYRCEHARFEDAVQVIRGQFMILDKHRIELLEPMNGASPLAPWLKRQIKFYHIGYLTDRFDQAIEHLVLTGATIAREALMSTYFGSRISFLMMPNMAMIEIIERCDQPEIEDIARG